MPSLQRPIRACVWVCLLAVALEIVVMVLPPSAAPLPAGTSMLSAHLLLELFAIVIAGLIVTVSWHTFDLQTDRSANVVIGGFLVVAVCDLVHALTYEGMPAFLGPSSTERAIFFWLMGRSVEVVVFGLIAAGWSPALSRAQSLSLGTIVALVLVTWGSWRPDLFPTTFVIGGGVTAFKAQYEFVICLSSLAIAIALWRRARARRQLRYYLMATSTWVIGVGELSFTNYVQPSDFQNLFGHFYKIAGYALLYMATFVQSLGAPFAALKRSESRAVDSANQVRSLSDHLPNCVVYQLMRDPDGTLRYLYVSEAIERLTGVTVAEMLADWMALYRRVPDEDRVQLHAIRQRAVELASTFEWEGRLIHRDGRERWVQFVSAPRRLSDGRVSWDGVMTDITDRRAIELRHRENEAMLAAVIESASDAVISADATGRITLFNPAAERIFGQPRAAFLGRPLEELLPAHLRPLDSAAAAPDERVGQASGDSPGPAAGGSAGATISPVRFHTVRADGTGLDLEASVSTVTVNERKVFTAILRDTTSRVRAERAVLQYQRELSALTRQLMAQEKETTRRLAQALHDQLGQTLTAIRLDFVSEARLADAHEAQRHERVDRLIDRAIGEVRQVLVDLRPTLLDEYGLAEALDNELRSRRSAADGVQLRLDAATGLASQRWHPDVEYAAFMVAREAIGNALAHAGASEVNVVLRGDARRLHLEVRDDGAGLRAEDRVVRPGHLGMIGMRERSVAIGAHFSAHSPEGGGTSVSLAWEANEP